MLSNLNFITQAATVCSDCNPWKSIGAEGARLNDLPVSPDRNRAAGNLSSSKNELERIGNKTGKASVCGSTFSRTPCCFTVSSGSIADWIVAFDSSAHTLSGVQHFSGSERWSGPGGCEEKISGCFGRFHVSWSAEAQRYCQVAASECARRGEGY